jgi:serine/threonine protein kinase
MSTLSAEEFAQQAADLELLDHRHLQELWAEIGSRKVSCQEFQQILLRRAYLTNYQAEKLMRGDRSGFFYGSYRVLYLVGTGTFARVYRAVHKFTGDVVAVKVLRKRFLSDHDQAERFHREGQMGATLQHPNIVPIREVVSHGENHYLVMDFVEGRNLREFVKIRKKIEPAEATKIVTEIASALDYAYERGLFHRDLKLSNVLISSRGEAKLVDFGLAAADRDRADDSLSANANPRTIDYAGLERATGVKRDDDRSDIYFLGCIYYHLLTGQPALTEVKDRSQRLSKTRFESVIPIHQLDPSLPKAIVPIVNKSMELNPIYRYQTPGEMLADLEAGLAKLADPNDPSHHPTRTERAKAAAGNAVAQRPLMFVESNVELQNVFRERLKTHGYRVLVTREPDRLFERFKEDPGVAECVIFSTGELGERARDAYAQFAKATATSKIPAVLLLGEHHQAWRDDAPQDKHHVVLQMPVKLGEFRTLMGKLLPPKAAAEAT